MAGNTIISCPNCGQQYGVTPQQWAEAQGRSIPCSKCGKTFVVGQGSGAAMPAAAMPPPIPTTSYAQGAGTIDTRRTSSVAIASLICGCLFFIPLASLAAIILGAIGIAKTRDPQVRGRGMAIAGLSLGAVGLVLMGCMISILLPSLNRARQMANTIKCQSNVRIIGQALQVYASQNRGAYPDTLAPLLADGTLSADALVCPSSNDTAAAGPTAQARAANLQTGGHLSYVYLGKGMNAHSTASNTVVLYEPPANHGKDGITVLFGDGHVEFVRGSSGQRLVNEVESGQNPPPIRGGKASGATGTNSEED